MNQFFPSPLKIAELQHLYKVLMQFMNDKHARLKARWKAAAF